MGGKRVRRALHMHKPRAKLLLDDLLELRRSQKHGYIPRDVSWNFFKHRYFQSRQQLSPRTQAMDRYNVAILERFFQIKDLRQLTPEFLIERIIPRLRKKNVTNSVVHCVVSWIKTAMRQAQAWKYVPMQNWDIVKTPPQPGRLDYYSVENVNQLLLGLKGYRLTAAILMVRAGLRSGEVYHLEWTDIHIPTHQISFRSKQHLGWKIKHDKNWTKVRSVPLDETLEGYLISLPRDSTFVLGAKRPSTEESFYVVMNEAIKGTGVATHLGALGSSHVLRHTFASHLISNGTSLEEIGDFLGHTDPKTTKIYAHLMPHARQKAIKNLPRLCSTFVPVPRQLQPS